MSDLLPGEMHTQTKEYLSLPRAYLDEIGGIAWSDVEGGLSFVRTKGVIPYESIAQFLEGFASQRTLLPFGSIIHGLFWFVLPSQHNARQTRLRLAFASQQQPWRNAGALLGMLTKALPPAVQAPPPETVAARLRDTTFPLQWFSRLLSGHTIAGEEPSLSPAEFNMYLDARLAELSDDDLAFWLKFGRGPVQTPRTVEPPPRTWNDIVADLLLRPRLAGARTHVAQMVAAISVPPRWNEPQQLPMGGYADVVTHGSVDRLLPSQHALDDLEFLRRFSENELLYFRREEPPAPHREEIVIVLDQGVRTWGDVRHVLTAAALALVGHAVRRKAATVRLAATSHSALVDPLDEKDVDLGSILEVSDLTPNPGLALERALEASPLRPRDTPRDIFLLTHPLARGEDDVRAAALRLAPFDRLFAITIDGHGVAELAEMRRGLPVRLKLFRVDFEESTTPPNRTLHSPANWTGDVDPLGWPFRFGVDAEIVAFDFDDAGERIFAVLANAMIYSWEISTGRCEILPRPVRNGVLVENFKNAVGVIGGLALLSESSAGHTVYHYDFASRRCHAIEAGASSREICTLLYIRNHHTLVVFQTTSQTALGTVQLSRQKWHEVAQPKNRTGTTLWEFANRGAVRRELPAVQSEMELREAGRRAYFFHAATRGIYVADGHRRWQSFTWKADGKGGNQKIESMQLAGTTLAIKYRVTEPFLAVQDHVELVRGPEGAWLRSFPLSEGRFLLSPGGEKVAIVVRDELSVHAADTPKRLLLRRPGNFGRARLWVGDHSFVLGCGRKGFSWHLVDWRDGFVVHSEVRPVTELRVGEFHSSFFRDFVAHRRASEATPDLGNDIFKDPMRARKRADRHGLCFLLDRYGQVLIFDSTNRLVLQFYAYGDSWTAWLPDGSRLGRGMIHEWPDTAGAAAAMAKALRSARSGGSS